MQQLAFRRLDPAANNLSVNPDAYSISSADSWVKSSPSTQTAKFFSSPEMQEWMLCRWIWVDPNIRQINAAMLSDSSLWYRSGIHSQVDHIHPNHTACSNLCKVMLIQIHRSSRNTDVSHLILKDSVVCFVKHHIWVHHVQTWKLLPTIPCLRNPTCNCRN